MLIGNPAVRPVERTIKNLKYTASNEQIENLIIDKPIWMHIFIYQKLNNQNTNEELQ